MRSKIRRPNVILNETTRRIRKTIAHYYKLTNLGGIWESGELKSATLTGMLRCCVLQDGISGVLTGVRPVPPPIRDSKLKMRPREGVLMGMPTSLSLVEGGWVTATLRLFGLGGLLLNAIA